MINIAGNTTLAHVPVNWLRHTHMRSYAGVHLAYDISYESSPDTG